MAMAPRCAGCGRFFKPDVRSQHHQKYCSPRCAKKAKRRRDKKYKRQYRETALGAEQRKRESEKRRDKLGWANYMRRWRQADPEVRAQQARRQARQYYQKHRVGILTKRRQGRRVQKAASETPTIGLTEADSTKFLVMG